MAIYTSYSQAWLEDQDSIKIVLAVAQVYNVLTAQTDTLYWSNSAYVTSDGLITFSAAIRRDVRLSETLSQDGSGAMTWGDIELDNQNGELDEYLDPNKYVWSNRSLKLYYGDPQWVCSSADVFTRFQLIFNGLTDDVDSRNRSSLNLKIRDKLEQLNTPITEDKLGTTGTWNGGQQNQDAIKPVVLGEVFNITPLLVDPSLLKYQVCKDPIEALLEIRDNGNPVYNASKPQGATVDLTQGTFTLTYPALGTITCSVQGVKTPVNLSTGSITDTPVYTSDLATTVATIVTQYGRGATGTRPSAKFLASDVDWANLFNFSKITPYSVALYIQDTQNVLLVCKAVAQSAGAQVFINRLGKLQLLRYGVSYNADNVINTVTESDILYNSLSISGRLPVLASVKLAYAKNYTIQNNLQTNIPVNHKETFATDWLTVTALDTATAGKFALSLEASEVETQLINTIDATAECNRRLQFVKDQHTVFKFTGTSRLLGLVLGQEVILVHSRYNLSSGLIGQVISLSPNWTSGLVDVEILGLVPAPLSSQTYSAGDYFSERYAL